MKNKLNIQDEALLEEAERQITSAKILDLKMNPLKGDLNFEHYIIDKITFNEQEKFIRLVAHKGSIFLKTFEYWKKNMME